MYLGRDVAPWQIVGIVEDVRQFAFDQPPTGQIFADMRQWSAPFVPIFPAGAYYAVRMSGDPSAFLANARGIARQLDADAALFSIAPMESIVATTVARPRMYAVLVTLFAGVGLVLALLGVYSVMSYWVAQRTREIGIRMSLGAERTNVVGLVLGQSAVVTAAGIVLGSAGAVALSGVLEGLLFGLSPLDLTTFATAAALFALTAMLAALVPARRATPDRPAPGAARRVASLFLDVRTVQHDRLVRRPQAQVDRLDENRETHRKVDVALRNVDADASRISARPIIRRNDSASTFTVGCCITNADRSGREQHEPERDDDRDDHDRDVGVMPTAVITESSENTMSSRTICAMTAPNDARLAVTCPRRPRACRGSRASL